jgi:hypothetical protein
MGQGVHFPVCFTERFGYSIGAPLPRLDVLFLGPGTGAQARQAGKLDQDLGVTLSMDNNYRVDSKCAIYRKLSMRS